jgi:monoamine oxidase
MATNLLTVYCSLIVLATAKDNQAPLEDMHLDTRKLSGLKRVAIIGAGIAGASAAYFISNEASLHGIDITIYYSSSKVGGRLKSVNYRGRTLEIGAQYWSNEDWCMARAMEKVAVLPAEL